MENYENMFKWGTFTQTYVKKANGQNYSLWKQKNQISEKPTHIGGRGTKLAAEAPVASSINVEFARIPPANWRARYLAFELACTHSPR